MSFLYERINGLRENGYLKKLPSYIPGNLNPKFELRSYQIAAFENFITYFESQECYHPTQVLFHMATGSGKTLIMAGLILYLYKKGYRNFLFFVNLSTIIKKTEDNFMNFTSNKYLFSDEIVIDGEHVQIRKVKNFQATNPDAINICFSTIQGLHTDMWLTKENSISFDDFNSMKTVLISDEAHHLNASTKKMNKEEKENYHSWEETVMNIFNRNIENVLLEFTATCDIENPTIYAAYENKIIFNYPLAQFYQDKYSKDIITLRSDLNIMERVLQALVLSQYRLKVFQDCRLPIKPIVLFKAAKIADNKSFMKEFIETIQKLSGEQLRHLSIVADSAIMKRAFKYFENNKISFDTLAQEIRDDFSEVHCVSVNDDKDVTNKQILLNSLEDVDNPYRAVFEVKKLDEGWDVLNLFDIVRLYETRQSGGKKISPTTMAEAQLIGRGARYCPFQIDNEQSKFQRKYDEDITNEMRICEELYYHCQNEHRYVNELKSALNEIGLDLNKVVKKEYVLKDDFRKDKIYTEGVIFVNNRVIKDRTNIIGLSQDVRDKIYTYTPSFGYSNEDILMNNSLISFEELSTNRKTLHFSIGEIADINYAIINKALMKYPIYKFNILKSYFPNISSTREFITSKNYLGNIRIDIHTKDEKITVDILYDAVFHVLGMIADSISSIKEEYIGTTEFYAKNIRDVFGNKTVNYTELHEGSIGFSQKDFSVKQEWRIDLSTEDWFAYTDNYGTSEEKAFVAYFRDYVDTFKAKYDKVYLVRNERQFHLHSFEGGKRFEPDYVLFLQNAKSNGYEQLQIFIEPKGKGFIKADKWKENFLLQIKEKSNPIIKFADDNEYIIWGIHFFNDELRSREFDKDFQKIINH